MNFASFLYLHEFQQKYDKGSDRLSDPVVSTEKLSSVFSLRSLTRESLRLGEAVGCGLCDSFICSSCPSPALWNFA
jgi:hypothetical protein